MPIIAFSAVFILLCTLEAVCCYRQAYCSSRTFARLRTATQDNPEAQSAPIAKKIEKPILWRRREEPAPKQTFSFDASENAGRVVKLSDPLILVRYRLPKAKTTFKETLDEDQRSYAGAGGNPEARSVAPRAPNSAADRQAFLPRQDMKKTSSKAKNDKEQNHRDTRSLESRPRSTANISPARKLSNRELFGETEGEESSNQDDTELFGSAISSGAQQQPGALPHGTVTALHEDGLSLEEMQSVLFAEYGLTFTAQALRRRLEDERTERSGRRRTGKTHRERVKARRRGEVAGPSVVLPADGKGLLLSELALQLEREADEIVQFLTSAEGVMVSGDDRLSTAIVQNVCLAFGANVVTAADVGVAASGLQSARNMHRGGVARPPIVTIMGHVDHGKTSLLDRIRGTSVAQREAGGITQTVSAFQITPPGRTAITFLDTPGHATFTAMRRRGAQVTDIVVLVVAVDDGVMEQTRESIKAAKEAGCPIVVAVSKVDKGGANADAVKAALVEEGVLVEDLGGECLSACVSAKTGEGVQDLLSKIALQAEVMDLRCDPQAKATGTVLDARKDRGLGVVATVLLRDGTLKVGDLVLAGQVSGKVRRMMPAVGTGSVYLSEAGPALPVQVIGLSGVPSAGDLFTVEFDDDRVQEVAASRAALALEAQRASQVAASLQTAMGQLGSSSAATKAVVKVPFVVKADDAGSLEALLAFLSSTRADGDDSYSIVDVVTAGVGEVGAADVFAATAGRASVLMYKGSLGSGVAALAKESGVKIFESAIIYELMDEVAKALQARVKTVLPGAKIGELIVKQVFTVGKSSRVAGCRLTNGVVAAEGCSVRVVRSGKSLFHGPISSLKVGKSNVGSVATPGSECGIGLKGFDEYEEGDLLEVYSKLNEL